VSHIIPAFHAEHDDLDVIVQAHELAAQHSGLSSGRLAVDHGIGATSWAIEVGFPGGEGDFQEYRAAVGRLGLHGARSVQFGRLTPNEVEALLRSDGDPAEPAAVTLLDDACALLTGDAVDGVQFAEFAGVVAMLTTDDRAAIARALGGTEQEHGVLTIRNLVDRVNAVDPRFGGKLLARL